MTGGLRTARFHFPPRQIRFLWTQAGDMKKTFPFSVPGHQPPRVVEAIKNDVRKYLKRERRKAVPEGVDFWDFECRVGHGDAEPQSKHVEEIISAIDQAAAGQCASVYIEILAIPGHRTKKSGPSSAGGIDQQPDGADQA